MTGSEAVSVLTMLCENLPDGHVAEISDGGDPATLAVDLCDWHNSTALEPNDIKALFELAKYGNFESWSCPICTSRVYMSYPDDWSKFQSARNTDYVSYPGYGVGILDKHCDHCRMVQAGAAYIPEGTHLEID